jgi:hypothetical protein
MIRRFFLKVIPAGHDGLVKITTSLLLSNIFTSQQCRPSSVSRIGPVAYRQRAGDFSIGIMAFFASALTSWFLPVAEMVFQFP